MPLYRLFDYADRSSTHIGIIETPARHQAPGTKPTKPPSSQASLSLRSQPLHMSGGADLRIALLSLLQQLLLCRIIAEHRGQLGAPFAQCGGERSRTGAFDQRGCSI